MTGQLTHRLRTQLTQNLSLYHRWPFSIGQSPFPVFPLPVCYVVFSPLCYLNPFPSPVPIRHFRNKVLVGFLRMDFLGDVVDELLLLMALTLLLKDLSRASSSVSDGSCCRRPLMALSFSSSSWSGFSLTATRGGRTTSRLLSIVDWWWICRMNKWWWICRMTKWSVDRVHKIIEWVYDIQNTNQNTPTQIPIQHTHKAFKLPSSTNIHTHKALK